MGRRVVIISGIPGCCYKPVVDTLQTWGYALTWPKQDCDVYTGNHCRLRGENPAVRELHDSILYDGGKDWFTTSAPKYYDEPYPGPDGVLEKFSEDQDIVLSDPMFCFFLPMWRGRYTDLILCDWHADSAIAAVAKWSGKEEKECMAVIGHYRERFELYSSGATVTRLSHAESRRGTCDGLEKEFKNRFLDR